MATKPTPEFTIEDLLAELQKMELGTDEEGWTIKELCTKKSLPHTHSHKSRIRRKLEDLRAEGLWEMRKKYVKNELGELRYQYCYRPVDTSKEK